jgi:8-oxo-dGTP pyrophosphatase MutT (NUDIX family)
MKRDNVPYEVVTAGAYVTYNGRYPFQVGPTKGGKTLGVVRLGGHRVGHETGWACAAREAWEEASVRIHPIVPPATYWVQNDMFRVVEWSLEPEDECPPVAVTTLDGVRITPIYLARTDDAPVPADVAALVLLSPDEVGLPVEGAWTLEQYLARGGEVRWKHELPRHLTLEPYPHLRILHRLLQLHPELPRQ